MPALPWSKSSIGSFEDGVVWHPDEAPLVFPVELL
jgi:hypothetical protein